MINERGKETNKCMKGKSDQSKVDKASETTRPSSPAVRPHETVMVFGGVRERW